MLGWAARLALGLAVANMLTLPQSPTKRERGVQQINTTARCQARQSSRTIQPITTAPTRGTPPTRGAVAVAKAIGG